jgi:hypothetical protein
MRCNFSNSLSMFPAVMNYLQMSPGSGSYFFLILAKWSRCTQINSLSTSHCSFTKPLLENPPPLKPHYFITKTLLKNITSVITIVIFTYNCVFHSSILVLVGLQKYSLVWYTSKHGVVHSPMLHSQHLYFVLVSLFLGEHTRNRILLDCMSQSLLCL